MTNEELKTIVDENKSVVLYFKNDACGPCLALRPKVQELIDSSFPEIKFVIVDTIEDPMLSSEYSVYSNPTILVYFEGKEYIRKSKHISIVQLKEEIERLYKMVF